eukprot:TRINITY_DN5891_c0_g1_i1.p1 TRINITY_DN5891_c0_g1~~TRINITY_DN5891_c0_g1_i1.p1  ORF type:complete len:297 (-),score=29.52 TRINITY_DN5891_c0_g1_i1:129-995(-)
MEALQPLFAGLRDALRVDIYKAFLKEDMQKHMLNCVKANGVFLVTNIVLNSIVAPLARNWLMTDDGTMFQTYVVPLLFLFTSLISYVGLCAMYVILLLLNGGYYLQIAEAMEKKINRSAGSPEVSSAGISIATADVVWENLLLLIFMVVTLNVVTIIPFFGTPLYFIYSCWGSSYYCFNYKWALLAPKWGSGNKIHYFESNWLYFIGFGTPMTILLYPWSTFVGLGIYAVLYPVFVAMAQISSPKKVTSPYLPQRIGIFQEARWLVEPSFEYLTIVTKQISNFFGKNK